MATTHGGIEVIDLTGSDSEEDENPLLQHLSRVIDDHQAGVLAMPSAMHHRSLGIRGREPEQNPPQDPTRLHDLGTVSPMQRADSASRSAPTAAVLDWLRGDPAEERPASRTRSRSPSVVFLGSRTLEAASPSEDSAECAPAAARVQQGRTFVRNYAKIHAAAGRASARFSDLTNGSLDAAELVLYTDGSIYKEQYGGAAIAYQKGNVWAGRALALGEMGGSCRAEMSAIFRALKLAPKLLLPQQRRLTIMTDSSSCLAWMADGCKESQYMEPVVTAAWEEHERLAKDGIKVTFKWVKGHAGVLGNVVADRIAGFASQKAGKGLMMNFDIPDVLTEFPDLAGIVKGKGVALQKKADRIAVRATASQDERRGQKRKLRLQHMAAERQKMLDDGWEAGLAAKARADAQASA